ncbi:hybrid sensor histidine kinase/response regulator [Halomonas saccharevitans]|uniref:histidine kinase n=1 Tax=Halomonas saccharevitans TaxID=416872 RepID=A0ABU3NEL3_9GAMM|nr:hybrid sensor histidine kinase/response regulator [Halomonas saccharevitans]MDT8879620.1 hybrid sensor histidine kinase/response regulator [Halomonas saccharevitans]
MACTSTRPSPGSPLDLDRPRAIPEDASPRERELLEENARLRRIAAALMERVESVGVAGAAPYAAFEHAVLLAEQVRERTEALQQTLAELHAAKAEAEAANLSKTRFLAAVSHDLMQPLNAARLFTSALEDHDLPAASTRLVGHVGRSLTDVEALLGTLVDISRLDAGVLEPDIAPFPVARLLDVLAEEFRHMAAARGLALHYVGSEAIIASDLALLARVVRNFLTNAIRYTEHGRILLGCRRRPDGLEILVGDTGPGIPEAQREAIFQEFQRLGERRDAEDRGLGLGLAIVDRIAGILDHPLRLASVPGRGSLFAVRVPFGRLPSSPARAPASAPAWEGDVLAGMRVWVVDDDPEICEGMAALLAGWGCGVRTATCLADLDTALETQAPGEVAEVLLVDYHLGEGDPDGLSVAARLRERQPGLAVVVITANHDASIKSLTRQLGYGCLLKPVKPLRLRMQLVGLRGGGSV